MELTGMQDLDERIAAIRADVAADMAEREAQAYDAAAQAVGVPLTRLGGRLVTWGTAPVTPALEGNLRVFALVGAALPVLALVIALINAA